MLANTLGNHKPSRRWTWHSPDGTHHNQIANVLVKKQFCSGIKTARIRTFPNADVGSDHNMKMTFRTRLKNSRKPTQPRIRSDLEKLNDPPVMNDFQANRWQICTACYTGRWWCWSGLHGHPLQQGSNWHSSWTSWQAMPEEEALGYSWDPWSLWPKTRPEEKTEASQKEPKTIERLKERSGQRWWWQKRLGYRVNARKQKHASERITARKYTS